MATGLALLTTIGGILGKAGAAAGPASSAAGGAAAGAGGAALKAGTIAATPSAATVGQAALLGTKPAAEMALTGQLTPAMAGIGKTVGGQYGVAGLLSKMVAHPIGQFALGTAVPGLSKQGQALGSWTAGQGPLRGSDAAIFLAQQLIRDFLSQPPQQNPFERR